MTRNGRKLYWILLIGLIAIGGAWAARIQILASRQRAAVAVVDPRVKALEAEAGRLNALVAASPQDSKLRWQLADTYQKLGQLDAAAVQLEAITHDKPNDQNAQLALGNTYLALKQSSKAEQIYRDATRRWPKVAAAWQGLAAVLYQQAQYKDAMDASQHAVQLTPADPNSHYMLGASALEYALEYPDPQLHPAELKVAQSELEKLVKVWPKNGDLYFRLARIQTELDHRKAAVEYLERALQLTPSGPIYSSLIAVLIATGNRPEALRIAVEGVARYPDSPGLHDLLGQAMQTSGAPNSNEKAVLEFEKAVHLDPRSEPYLERLGTAYLRVNRMPEARKAFETAVVLDPNRTFPFQQLSAIYTRMGDPTRATTAAKLARQCLYNNDLLTKVQDALIADPKNVSLHLVLADRYRDLGLNGAARNEYEAALELDPQNKHAQAGLAGKPAPTARSPVGHDARATVVSASPAH